MAVAVQSSISQVAVYSLAGWPAMSIYKALDLISQLHGGRHQTKGQMNNRREIFCRFHVLMGRILKQNCREFCHPEIQKELTIAASHILFLQYETAINLLHNRNRGATAMEHRVKQNMHYDDIPLDYNLTFDESCQPQTNGRDRSSQSRILLDSAAYPTHVPYLHDTMKPVR